MLDLDVIGDNSQIVSVGEDKQVRTWQLGNLAIASSYYCSLSSGTSLRAASYGVIVATVAAFTACASSRTQCSSPGALIAR